jgi:hypothetical protein
MVMLDREFDAVDYFVHEPGRLPIPPEKLGIYLASRLTQSGLADHVDDILAGMQAVLDETVPVTMRPHEFAHAVVGRRTGSGAWRGEKTRQFFVDVLRAGEMEGMDISFWARRDLEDRFWNLEIQMLPDQPETALQISVTPSDNLWPAESTDMVAQRLVGLVEAWTGPLDLLTGAITLDRVAVGYSPWEQWYGINVNQVAPSAYDCLRGYYWWNLLTAGHLAKLGGPEALHDRAQRAGFTATPPTGGQAWVVRDPAPVSAFDDDALARMKELLAPALYPQPYGTYEGYPLRIIKDPDTAFRRVPVTELRPLLLTDEEIAAYESTGNPWPV